MAQWSLNTGSIVALLFLHRATVEPTQRLHIATVEPLFRLHCASGVGVVGVWWEIGVRQVYQVPSPGSFGRVIDRPV